MTRFALVRLLAATMLAAAFVPLSTRPARAGEPVWKPFTGTYVVTRDGEPLWKESLVVEDGDDGGVRIRAFIRGSAIEDIQKLESTVTYDAKGQLVSAVTAGLAANGSNRGFEYDLVQFSRGLNPATVTFGKKESTVATVLRNNPYEKKEKVARPDYFLYRPFLHYYALPVLLGRAPEEGSTAEVSAAVVWPQAPFPWMWAVPEFRTGTGKDLMEGSAHTMTVDSFYDEKSLEAASWTLVRHGESELETASGKVTATRYELTLPEYVVNVYVDADGKLQEIYIPAEKVQMKLASGR